MLDALNGGGFGAVCVPAATSDERRSAGNIYMISADYS
jgi:hypothetical protein